jgi:hypothetical protein
MTRSFLATAVESFESTLRELGLTRGSPDVEDPARLGRRAALVAAAEAVWTKHAGPLLDAKQVQDLLGVDTRQAVSDLRARRRLLGLPKESGRVVYPAFQFGDSGRPFQVLSRVLEVFEERARVDPWTIASWFVTPQTLLARMTPAEWLAKGEDPEMVVRAARRSAARLGR